MWRKKYPQFTNPTSHRFKLCSFKVFKSGESYLGFIHLFFTIATEIGVFHDLGPMCITSLKESMFRGFNFSRNSGGRKVSEENLHFKFFSKRLRESHPLALYGYKSFTQHPRQGGYPIQSRISDIGLCILEDSEKRFF